MDDAIKMSGGITDVIIRKLRKEDAYVSVNWRNDPEVFKYTGNTYSNEIYLSQELEWIEKVIRNKDEKRYAIEADGVYVGNIYLTGIHNGVGHYHIFIGEKDYWGKGVAYRASVKILEVAFNELGLQVVSLNVKEENVAAVKLYLRLGFKAIGSNGDNIRMECHRDSVEL